MFGPLSDQAQIFARQSLTYNYHHDGVVPNKFLSDKGLGDVFKPTSYSYDDNGKVFVATMESTRYPFYGVQFHPEKS